MAAVRPLTAAEECRLGPIGDIAHVMKKGLHIPLSDGNGREAADFQKPPPFSIASERGGQEA